MEKNYIIIFDGGQMAHIKELDIEILQSFENGECDIIDISDPNNPLENFNTGDGWEAIEPVED